VELRTLSDTLIKNVTEQADDVAVRLREHALTWADLDQRSSQMASALTAAGVAAGDRVAFIDKNSVEFFEMAFGAAKIGAVPVPVNWRLAAPEMAYIINDAGAVVVFIHSDFAEHLAAMRGELTSVDHIVVMGEAGDDEAYEDWLAAHAADGFERHDADPHDVALQLYTSGTTGHPKGAQLTHYNATSLIEVASDWGMNDKSVSLAAMPLFHIGGSGWALFGMAMGAETVLLREADLEQLLSDISTYGITHAFLVPAVLQFLQIMPLDGIDLSSMELIVYGASPITEEVLVGSMTMFGCEYMQVYGLTETCGAVTMLPPEDHQPGGDLAELLRAAGKPMRGVELRIVDPETGDDAADGDVGEVWIKSPTNMAGYWNLPEASAEALPGGGWFRSGDAGYMKNGYLFLHDRVKDMIISGGENIYPAEIENVLMGHDEVADVAVIGVPSDKWGETPKAIVVVAADTTPTAEELIEFCRTQLARFKCPTSVDFVDSIPRNPTGKILKRELRAPFWEGRERAVN
jgi:long-chain acyl-CoA synthetase